MTCPSRGDAAECSPPPAVQRGTVGQTEHLRSTLFESQSSDERDEGVRREMSGQ